MARSHLRYSVTDRAGNSVQNAAVNIYQRGTTTPVTNLWTAASGGSASPNPLITNNQGEIEGWLDVAQSVTLRITDNTDAAYYPSTPGSLLSWTPFSEDIEVIPAPEDIGAPHAHPYEASGSVETHRLDTTSVHGIADTALLETQAGAQSKVDAEAVLRANADALLIPLTQKAAANGVATLDAGSLVPTAQLPPLSISETFTVASQAAMLALTAQRGDVAIRTDLSRAFILSTDSPGTLGDWKELLTPVDAVTSVDGRTGVVSLTDLYAPFAHSDDTTNVHGIADTANLVLTGDARLSDTRVPTDGSVTNAKVAAGAAIAYSKLNLTGAVLEADLAFAIATQTELTDHEADTTSVHGIADTAQIALKNAANVFTAAQQIPLGTAALPGLTPASDPNTGLWSPGGDILAWSTNGVERMRLTAAGYFGVGVDPIAPLQVKAATNVQFIVLNSGTKLQFAAVNDAYANIALQLQGLDVHFFTGASETHRMRIDSEGVVTIGTGAPGASAAVGELELSGAAKGIILTSATGNRFRTTVTDLGTLTTVAA